MRTQEYVKRWRARAVAAIVVALAMFAGADEASAQCRPVSERDGELGCWILAREPLGRLSEATVFWHLDTYPTRSEAEAARGPRGTVIEALGKVWLFTVAAAGWRPAGGVRIAEIGPLPVKRGEQHMVQYMETIGNRSMTTGAHYHPGPEVLYTTAGELCFEMPHGKVIGRAGEGTVMEPGHMHTLTALGSEQRRSVALVIHESSQPWSIPAPEWTPKGLCK